MHVRMRSIADMKDELSQLKEKLIGHYSHYSMMYSRLDEVLMKVDLLLTWLIVLGNHKERLPSAFKVEREYKILDLDVRQGLALRIDILKKSMPHDIKVMTSSGEMPHEYIQTLMQSLGHNDKLLVEINANLQSICKFFKITFNSYLDEVNTEQQRQQQQQSGENVAARPRFFIYGRINPGLTLFNILLRQDPSHASLIPSANLPSPAPK